MLNVVENTKTNAAAQPSADTGEQKRTVPKSLADWFHYSVIRSRKEVFSEVVLVTPELAQLFLTGNEANRAVNARHISALASDMVDGRWDLNGESIKISTDGRLADGQHRCFAIIEAGVPVQTVVTFGVSYESRLTTDQNRAKNVGDYLAMDHGTKYAQTAATVANYHLKHRIGVSMNGGSYVTKTRIRAEYENFRTEIDSAISFIGSAEQGRAIIPSTMLAFALMVLRRKSPNADDFIMKFKTGIGLSSDDPILVARNTAIRNPRLSRDERFTLLMRAFDAWINDRKVGYYKLTAKKGK